MRLLQDQEVEEIRERIGRFGKDRCIRRKLELKGKGGVMTQIARVGIGLGLWLGLMMVPAAAQSSQNSSTDSPLGDYARQIRKDSGAKANQKVFDNDNLPKSEKLSVIGQQEPAPAAGEAKSEEKTSADASTEKKPAEGKDSAETKPAAETKSNGDSKAPAKSEEKPVEDEAAKQAALKQWDDKIAKQKDEVSLLTRELDVLQREYQIRAAAMYADAGNRLRNQADWDKLDAQYKQQIADKQKSLDEAKQKVEDLQEEARKAGAEVNANQ